jgi:hypothetical protein
MKSDVYQRVDFLRVRQHAALCSASKFMFEFGNRGEGEPFKATK